ncbi:MAG: hydroxymethylglutaryl-CoA lyase [Gammaproteobacteria bacterium]|nr:hydroxymethylglutaryl-CoA lyase [Gammaproteobacteria bacterium]
MRDEVTLLEVSPRDGLQNEPGVMTTADKLELIGDAIAAGARRIEVTSFVHPKKVPQMADAEAVCAGLPDTAGIRYTGLVLNRRGLDRALATGRLHEVGMVVPASDTFGIRNQAMDVEAALAAAEDVIAAARDGGIGVQVTLAVAFGCPFEGEVPADRVLAMATRLAAVAPDEICLADTVGVAVPSQVLHLFTSIRKAIGPGIPLRAHFHNTRNTGFANAFAALQADVSVLDASIGGIGGCPFAPKATGNIASEDLIYMLERMGVRTGVSLDGLIEAAERLGSRLGRPVPGLLAKAGGFPAPEAA